MADNIRKVWITKYALTKGVYETEVRVLDGFSAGKQDKPVNTFGNKPTRDKFGDLKVS